MNKTISEIFGYRKRSGTFGVEVESEFTEDIGLFSEEGWIVDRDHSLRGVGYEFIFREPLTYSSTVREVGNLFSKKFYKDNFKYTHRAGIHVHLNCLNWTEDRVLRFLLAYYLVEELMISYTDKERLGNLFCLRMNDAEGVLEAVRMIVDGEWTSLRENFANYKYSALNVASLARIGTLEFRALESTDNIEKFVPWLSMINNLSAYSFEEKNLEDVYAEFIHDRGEFAKRVLGGEAPVLEGSDVMGLLDANVSNAYAIITLTKTKQERKAKSKKKVQYSFPSSERAVDIGEEFFDHSF